MNILKILQSLFYLIPTLMSIIKHYEILVQNSSLDQKDKDKSKSLLHSLRWTPWEDL